ncbi:MAG: hypothetical protein WA892_05830 [Ornithinimicrobium sp.]
MTDWSEITTAISTTLSGDRDAGRAALLAGWGTVSEAAHAKRCVLAHFLADLEADVDDEVAWDERALAAYQHVGESDLAPLGIPSAQGLAPSLHLNLGDGYLRQGRADQARRSCDAGLAAATHLGDDGYGAMIRRGLEHLDTRITHCRRLHELTAETHHPLTAEASSCGGGGRLLGASSRRERRVVPGLATSIVKH